MSLFWFYWLWIFRWIKLLIFKLYLCFIRNKLGNWIDPRNFFLSVYLSFTGKDSATRIHDLAVSVKEGLPFTRYLSLENCKDSYLCFQQGLLHSVSFYFLLSITTFIFLDRLCRDHFFSRTFYQSWLTSGFFYSFDRELLNIDPSL